MKEYERYFNRFQPTTHKIEDRIGSDLSWTLPVFFGRQELECPYTDGSWTLCFFVLNASSSSSILTQNGGLQGSVETTNKRLVFTQGGATLNIPYTELQNQIAITYDFDTKKLKGYCNFEKVAEVTCNNGVLPNEPFVFESNIISMGCLYFFDKELDADFFAGLKKYLYLNDNVGRNLVDVQNMTPEHPTAVARPSNATWTFNTETGEWEFPNSWTGAPQIFNMNMGQHGIFDLEFEFTCTGGSMYPYVVSANNGGTAYNNAQNPFGIIVYPNSIVVVWMTDQRNSISMSTHNDGLWHKVRFQMNTVTNTSILEVDDKRSVYNGSGFCGFTSFRIGVNLWNGNNGYFYGKVKNVKLQFSTIRDAERFIVPRHNIYLDPLYKSTYALFHNAKQLAYYPPSVSGINNEVYDLSPYHNKFMWCYNLDVDCRSWGTGEIDKMTIEFWALRHYTEPYTPWSHAIINNAIKNSAVPVHIVIQHDRNKKTNDVYINGKFVQRFTNVGQLTSNRFSDLFISDLRYTKNEFRYDKDFTPTIFTEY